MKKIQWLKWLFVTNIGRYVLGITLVLTGVFSQYGTIDFIRINWALFEYTSMGGAVIILGQFVFHVSAALYYNFKKK